MITAKIVYYAVLSALFAIMGYFVARDFGKFLPKKMMKKENPIRDFCIKYPWVMFLIYFLLFLLFDFIATK